MKKHYVTFGQAHRRVIEDGGRQVTLNHNVVARFPVPDGHDGRTLAFAAFGPKFSFEYPEEHFDWEEKSRYFPGGIVDIEIAYDGWISIPDTPLGPGREQEAAFAPPPNLGLPDRVRTNDDYRSARCVLGEVIRPRPDIVNKVPLAESGRLIEDVWFLITWINPTVLDDFRIIDGRVDICEVTTGVWQLDRWGNVIGAEIIEVLDNPIIAGPEEVVRNVYAHVCFCGAAKIERRTERR